ncbi:MAG TPA: hypothetical protein VGO52_08390, partial [Hyphomonadaceae bacterium]|nr:hypothetical protein [Hyphomonadaceae bacterium]
FTGAGFQILGFFLMSQLHPGSGSMEVIWRMFILGIGLGPAQSLFNMVSQSAAPVHQIGVATSTGMFLRQTGGMVGVSVLGAILQTKLSESGALPGGGKFDMAVMEKFAMAAKASGGGGPIKIPPAIAQAFTDAMSYIFIGALFIVVVAVVAIYFIPQITLRGRGPGQNLEKAVEGVAPEGPITRNAPATGAAD